jgi:hypothetical protein
VVGAYQGRVSPLSVAILARDIGPHVHAARHGIQRWLLEQQDYDFDEAARLVVPAIQLLLERGWLTLNEAWTARVRAAIECATSSPRPADFRGAVAELTEIVWWVLNTDQRPHPPRGPAAAQLFLVKPNVGR